MRAILATILVLLGASSSAPAQVLGFGGGAPNTVSPYSITEYFGFSGFNNTVGRITVSAALTAGEKTAIIFVPGQSNATNVMPTAYVPANAAKCNQINIYDGLVYQMRDPVLGAVGAIAGTWMSRLCDSLINDGTFQRVIMIPMAIPGTTAAQWQTVLAQRVYVAVLRARALGYLASNADVHPFFLVSQGEQDGLIGTSSADYQASWLAVIEIAKGLGCDVNWFFAEETMVSNTTSSTIRGAQAALVNAGAKRLAGADMDSLTGSTNRQCPHPEDCGTHLTDTGAANAAMLWKAILAAAYP
jgi:hypothetical protein